MRNNSLILLCCVLAFAKTAACQDDHYWSQQFGAVSTSMGGAVVGGVRDNSAIFYNPGAQAFIDNPSLSVDADLYKIDRLMIRNGAGENVNLNSTEYSIYPQIVAGLINLVTVPRFNFGYCILTRNHTNVLMNTRFTNRDLENNPDPNAEFISAFDYSNQMDEQWLGLSASYKINEKHGIGVTLFGSYKWQTYSMTKFIREIRYVDTTVWFNTFNIDEYVDYSMVHLLAKFGWAFETGRWRVGISATSPAIRFYGRGTIQREVSFYSASDRPGDTATSFLILDRKKSVKTYSRYPFALSAGAEYHTSRTRVALTAEFFTGTAAYNMMSTESDPLVYPPWIKDSADVQQYLTGYLNLETQSRPVLNVALGFSQDLSKKFALLLGARTDFSSFKKSENTDILIHDSGEWDLYNVSAGVSYHNQKQTVTLGFSYTFSPKKSIDPYAILNPLSPESLHSTVFSQTFGLILGYTHYIKY
jgi:long-subunit fatty acid transport protein